MYLAYKDQEVVVLFSVQTNHNKKIALTGQLILNQFSFSKKQWEGDLNFSDFFAADAANCLNCVRRGKENKCYTRKYHQFLSFVNHIKKAKEELGEIPDIKDFNWDKLYSVSKSLYIRFGVYGEPIFVPFENMGVLISNAYTYTGYTHAWKQYPEYKKHLLASCDNIMETFEAMAEGWKTYTAIKDKKQIEGNEKNFINCPASKESGKMTVCSICKMCNTKIKGKPIYIMEH